MPLPYFHPHPLVQQLTSLHITGVIVSPRLLSSLRHLTHLSRLHLSVSCPRPYEPLALALPHLPKLTHLHLFLHTTPQHNHTAQRVGSHDTGPQAQQDTYDTYNSSEGYGHSQVAGGGGGDGRGGEGRCSATDLTPVDLAAALSQCKGLVSLALPGEELDAHVPVLLQVGGGAQHALPGFLPACAGA